MHVLCFLILSLSAQVQASVQLQVYPTKYYDIYTDVDEAIVREAALRLTYMAEEYHRRTKSFAGQITSKFPLYIYRYEADYLAAGGLQGSSGVYTGTQLMAYVGQRNLDQLWRALQHEGFHQFVDVVIGGDFPVWANEGLAEYFEEAVFTGDAYIAGLVPVIRRRRIKDHIARHAFVDLVTFMRVSRKDWNEQLSIVNYDQAWSLVHFLAHANNGKYRDRFDHFMRDVSRMGADQAWVSNFGPNTKGLSDAWAQYWLRLPENHGGDLYIEVTVATLTSFLARNVLEGGRYPDAASFIAAANTDEFQIPDAYWLPPIMLVRALQHARMLEPWTLTINGESGGSLSVAHRYQQITGIFELSNHKIKSVTTKRLRR